MIRSDDPNAIELLQKQLDTAKDMQERMKTVNSLVRKNDRATLAALGYTDQQVTKFFTPDYAGRTGFAAYELTNNNANIKRIEGRIAELMKNAQVQDSSHMGNGYLFKICTTEQRVMFNFDSKPSEEVRAMLKSNGFKFSPSRDNAWVRQLNANGICAGQMLCKRLDSMNTPAAPATPAA